MMASMVLLVIAVNVWQSGKRWQAVLIGVAGLFHAVIALLDGFKP